MGQSLSASIEHFAQFKIEKLAFRSDGAAKRILFKRFQVLNNAIVPCCGNFKRLRSLGVPRRYRKQLLSCLIGNFEAETHPARGGKPSLERIPSSTVARSRRRPASASCAPREIDLIVSACSFCDRHLSSRSSHVCAVSCDVSSRLAKWWKLSRSLWLTVMARFLGRDSANQDFCSTLFGNHNMPATCGPNCLSAARWSTQTVGR